MKKDFDFKQINKEMPYRVPDHFFDEMEKEIVHRALKEEKAVKVFPFRRHLMAALSAAALITGVLFLIQGEKEVPVASASVTQYLVEATEQKEVEAWDEYMYNLTDEELEEALSMAELDVFMED